MYKVTVGVEAVGFVTRTMKDAVEPLEAEAGPVTRSCGCRGTVPETANEVEDEIVLAEPA